MQTKFGTIPTPFPLVTNLNHNLVTNEISGTISYYLSEVEAVSGQFEPIARKNVSWLIDGDNNSIAQQAIDKANA
jgi:hypothetical protein